MSYRVFSGISGGLGLLSEYFVCQGFLRDCSTFQTPPHHKTMYKYSDWLYNNQYLIIKLYF
ncbi:hypothetical protein HanRHA438_Chr08g0347281 [Helianthus annuus]|nr:hypothetical protein HanRHA438_Chr08g0347281 [Helianthus annuus]